MMEPEESSYDYTCNGCGKNIGENGSKTVFWPMGHVRIVLCPVCHDKCKYIVTHLSEYMPLLDDGK